MPNLDIKYKELNLSVQYDYQEEERSHDHFAPMQLDIESIHLEGTDITELMHTDYIEEVSNLIFTEIKNERHEN